MPTNMRLEEPNLVVDRAVEEVGGDPARLMDVARKVMLHLGRVDDAAIARIAAKLDLPPVQVEGLVTFYAFLDKKQLGEIVIRLCDDVVDRLAGYDAVAAAFKAALGLDFGETSKDGLFTLQRTPCIGMCDQAPAALVNEVVLTRIDPAEVPGWIEILRKFKDPRRLVRRLGEGLNSHALIDAMVNNNIRHTKGLLLSPEVRGDALRKALALTPQEVIRSVKAARLRGRGGAGFPTGMKWEFTRMAAGEKKVVICNADEGEPGTFKDRVLLTERPSRVIAGLTIAGYAVGAELGILYLRAEYAYLYRYLNDILDKRREDGLLGHGIGKRLGLRRSFDFDIRIQLGAGAYICGEESALIESCEGKRGDPRNRPPFPAQAGYKGRPTSVNNVETLCCVTKIMQDGAANFSAFGTDQSAGTKLLSISGDCARPGVYEVEFGITVREVLAMAGCADAGAVLVGGPSGRFVAEAEFDRKICFDDLATGGAFVVFGHGRDLLQIVSWYIDFFNEESCGYCAPCRAGNQLLRLGLERVRSGAASPADVKQLRELGRMMVRFSRCGLGQTSSNPILTTLESFEELYGNLVIEDQTGVRRSFDLEAELETSRGIQGPGIESQKEAGLEVGS